MGVATVEFDWSCTECGKSTDNYDDYYMLKHGIWLTINNNKRKGLLCWSCAEKRLGRKIKTNDLLECGINELNNSRKTVLLT